MRFNLVQAGETLYNSPSIENILDLIWMPTRFLWDIAFDFKVCMLEAKRNAFQYLLKVFHVCIKYSWNGWFHIEGKVEIYTLQLHATDT